MRQVLSKPERDAYWRRLSQVFPRVPQELDIETGGADGPDMKIPTSPLALQFSQDGEHIIAAGGGRLSGCDSTIRVFDADEGHEMLLCRGHIHGIYSLAVDPHSGFVASASEDFSVILWNLEERDAIFLTGGEPIVKGDVAFAAEKRRIAIGEKEAYEDHVNSAFVLDLDSGREVFRQKLTNRQEVASLAFSVSGDTLVVAVHNYQGSPSGTELFCWDLSDTARKRGFLARLLSWILGRAPQGKCLWSRTIAGQNLDCLRWLPGEQRLVAATVEDGGDYSSGACLLDARSGEILAERVQPGIGACVAVSPDGRTVALAYGEGGIELLNAADLSLIKSLAPRRTTGETAPWNSRRTTRPFWSAWGCIPGKAPRGC